MGKKIINFPSVQINDLSSEKLFLLTFLTETPSSLSQNLEGILSGHGALQGPSTRLVSAYRKPAFQPLAFRWIFIGFQPSAENQPNSMKHKITKLFW